MNPLGHVRASVRRHPHLADAAVAAAVFAATAATALTGRQPGSADGRAVAVVSAVLACGTLTGRRRWPVAVLTVSAVTAEVFLLVIPDASSVLILLAPSIALYTVAELMAGRRGLLIGAGVLAALAVAHMMAHRGMIGPENLAFIALGGLAIAAGDSSRHRRAYLGEVEQRAERSERERELTARRQVERERLRIARDLHDSVGHHLALISVQSDVAGQALDGDTAAAREALLHVKAASRKALIELRDTVSLLRQPGDPVAPVAVPAPGLDALAELLGSLRAAGLAIDCRVVGAVRPLAPAADVTAYRVIQESLTNVRKHSRSGRARLTLGYGRDGARITVDDLPRGAPGAPGAGQPGADRAGGSGPETAGAGTAGGHGIAGMRERVLALGGRLTAGPRPDGGFVVDAALPYQAGPADAAAPVQAGPVRAAAEPTP